MSAKTWTKMRPSCSTSSVAEARGQCCIKCATYSMMTDIIVQFTVRRRTTSRELLCVLERFYQFSSCAINFLAQKEYEVLERKRALVYLFVRALVFLHIVGV